MEDAHESQRSDDADVGNSRAAGFTVSAVLLAVAFVGATTAGVLDSVGAYLLGVSVLVATLFVVVRR